MQYTLLLLFLVLAAVIALVFITVYLSSRKSDDELKGMANPLQKRFWFLLILFVCLGIFAFITIPRSPYYLFAKEQPAKVVHIAAGQFFFTMSYKAINPDKPEGEMTIELPVNQLVEFRVTSLDVNHGFAIYSPSKQIVAQTQAMPGYVNLLRWKFKEPGTYTVHCLEYCGMAHQVMQTTFTVK